MSALHTTTIIASLALRHPGHHIQHTLSWLSRADDLPLANASFYEAAILDHFDGSVGATPRHWRQRYYFDSRFWCGSGCPVFLYIGGEGPQGPPSPRLYIWTLAEKHGALLVALEHRFYGESRPTADLSTANLQYLTSSQALADLARFRSMISAYQPGVTDTSSSPPLVLPASPNASKWVSFGGSYPGNLATWLKAKYPALVDGTVGSSAPVLAHYDFAQCTPRWNAGLLNARLLNVELRRLSSGLRRRSLPPPLQRPASAPPLSQTRRSSAPRSPTLPSAAPHRAPRPSPPV
jgi:serine protease 16